MATHAFGTKVVLDGEEYIRFMFSNREEADSFVMSMTADTDEIIATAGAMQSGGWCVLLSQNTAG